jgi:hypothetical protein
VRTGGSLCSRATVGNVTARHPIPEERDERVEMPLDPETALRAMLRVKPDDPPADAKDSPHNYMVVVSRVVVAGSTV